MSQIIHSVSTKTALQLVANQRCRSILTRLIEGEDNTVTLDALVKHVAPENPPPKTAAALQTEPLLIDLHHNLLPKLVDAGLIEYDTRSETVRYHPNERVEKVHTFVTTELESD